MNDVTEICAFCGSGIYHGRDLYSAGPTSDYGYACARCWKTHSTHPASPRMRNAAPIELTINTRDHLGQKQPLDSAVAVSICQAAQAIYNHYANMEDKDVRPDGQSAGG